MIFGFVAKHRGIWPVAFLCEALGVSRSGFYAWLTRGPSARSRRDEVLSVQIRSSFQDSYRTYGARRVWHDVLAAGIECGLHAIERLMRRNGLRARPRKHRVVSQMHLRSRTMPAVRVLLLAFGRAGVLLLLQ
jgi:putative transposase